MTMDQEGRDPMRGAEKSVKTLDELADAEYHLIDMAAAFDAGNADADCRVFRRLDDDESGIADIVGGNVVEYRHKGKDLTMLLVAADGGTVRLFPVGIGDADVARITEAIDGWLVTGVTASGDASETPTLWFGVVRKKLWKNEGMPKLLLLSASN